MANDTSWSEQQIAVLARLWHAGEPTRRIGERIGKSKGAVIGKSHRLGLEPRQNPVKRGVSAKETRHRQVRDSLRQAQAVSAVNRGVAPVMAQRRMAADSGRLKACQWIDGEPSADDACKCGEPVMDGRAWCADHFARCYIKRRVRVWSEEARMRQTAIARQHLTLIRALQNI